MESFIGKIRFLPVEEGAKDKLPKGMISTPAIFNDYTKKEFGLWSKNVYLITEFDLNREAIARFRFLLNDSPDAPLHLLFVGSEFTLVTNRIIANCIVTHIVNEEDREWFCPAVERVIDEGLCWEYCFADNGGPIDTAQKLDLWIKSSNKFKDIEEFQEVCEICTHCQWTK